MHIIQCCILHYYTVLPGALYNLLVQSHLKSMHDSYTFFQIEQFLVNQEIEITVISYLG